MSSECYHCQVVAERWKLTDSLRKPQPLASGSMDTSRLFSHAKSVGGRETWSGGAERAGCSVGGLLNTLEDKF